MQRYSRKRESILLCVQSTKEHPDAEWVYARLKPDYPDLSLATVYRNLKQLEREGLIRSVGKVGNRERFDADTSFHTHIVCAVCKKMTDVEGIVLPPEFLKKASDASGFEVCASELKFTGLCPECRKKM